MITWLYCGVWLIVFSHLPTLAKSFIRTSSASFQKAIYGAICSVGKGDKLILMTLLE